MNQIAIVGGGPAGAICGERLASSGLNVTIYDEHLAWEKPCGGGLTHKAIEAYPFLLDSPYPKKIVRTAELIASTGHRATFHMNHPIVIYSRTALNGLLLDRASAAGCHTARNRVTAVKPEADGVRLCVAGQETRADFVVLAGGARNQLLPETVALGAADLEMTQGYFVPADEQVIKIKFLKKFEGYLWSFPRADHISVGICGKLNKNSSKTLRAHLDEFLAQEKISLEGAQFYSHVLPSPQLNTLRGRRIVGNRWALAGDAAACVDPITGEGLFYAMRSGDLLAQALIERQPESYPARLRAEISGDLEFAARFARKVFLGTFLGAACTTRMIQFLNRSNTFSDLIRDVFSGSQNYASLKRRVWSQLGITVAELTRSVFTPPSCPSARRPTPQQ